VGQRRDRSGHGRLRHRDVASLVVEDRIEGLSSSAGVAGGRRWGWEQQQSWTAVEGRRPETCGPDRPHDFGLPLPTGYEQMEQDRTPDVLPYHGELAWCALEKFGDHGEPDWPYNDAYGITDRSGVGHQPLPNRFEGQGCG